MITYHGVIQIFESHAHDPTRDRTDDEAPPSSASSPASSEGGDRAGKKERVLHTRVPEVLERELKRFAESLRMPVSNLVRTILEDAVNAADVASSGVEQRLMRAARQLEHERERLKKKIIVDPLSNVFAFQAVRLARATSCAKCKTELSVGANAHLGLVDGATDAPKIFVCDTCVPKGD